MMLNKEAIISCLIDKKICTKEEMEGCSLENVEMLEKNASLSLPLQYREFLLGIGRGAGILFQGTDIFFPSIIGLKTDRKSTRLNSSHLVISYAVFCLKKKKNSMSVPSLIIRRYLHINCPLVA